MKRKTMTRQQLYELVWSRPMRDAATTIPISDVGLKKVCRRHNVPVPPRGHWNKVRAGHPMPDRPTLPPLVSGQRNEFEFFAPAPLHGAALESVNTAIERARVGRAAPLPEHLHECAEEMKHALQQSRTDARGAYDCKGTMGFVHMLVWPQTLGRAIELLSTLCHAAERVGCAVSFLKRERAGLEIEGEFVPFAIREKFKRPSRLLTAKEWYALTPYQRAIGTRRQSTYVPLGKLEITLEGAWVDGQQKRFSDRPGKLVEVQLDDVLAAAAVQAAALKERRAKLDRKQAADAEAVLRRQEADKQAEREEERRAFLLERADAYDEAERLAAFVNELQRKARRSRPPHLAALLEWAHMHVQALREACSIDKMEKDLVWSGLFNG